MLRQKEQEAQKTLRTTAKETCSNAYIHLCLAIPVFFSAHMTKPCMKAFRLGKDYANRHTCLF